MPYNPNRKKQTADQSKFLRSLIEKNRKFRFA